MSTRSQHTPMHSLHNCDKTTNVMEQTTTHTTTNEVFFVFWLLGFFSATSHYTNTWFFLYISAIDNTMMICDHVEFDCAVDPQHIHTPLHPTHPITTIKPQQPTLPPLTSSTTTITKLFGGVPPSLPHPPTIFIF